MDDMIGDSLAYEADEDSETVAIILDDSDTFESFTESDWDEYEIVKDF
jgi:hypothetical protein